MEAALEEMPLELINISDLAKRAGKSVGSFYTKFRDKEELLDAVLRRYEDERASMEDSMFLPGKWVGVTLAERVRGVVAATVEEYRTRRGLFLAYQARARLRPFGASSDEIERLKPLYDAIADLLAECRDEIVHDDAERASRFAFFMLTSLCSSAILHSADAHSITISLNDDELGRRCVDAMLSYLAGAAR